MSRFSFLAKMNLKDLGIPSGYFFEISFSLFRSAVYSLPRSVSFFLPKPEASQPVFLPECSFHIHFLLQSPESLLWKWKNSHRIRLEAAVFLPETLYSHGKLPAIFPYFAKRSPPSFGTASSSSFVYDSFG